nr:integrase, catalytic region, zinc finger, CCHC-type, peptidase aspartic, catalytic [Tanacetum cinerariifolium]
EFIDKDQAGPDPSVSRMAIARPNPEPTHKEIMANVYPNVYGSLKFLADKHVILEEPLSSFGTLSSMKNLDDAYAIRDQFLNDKPTEDELSKLNVDSEEVSMITVLIHQASSLVTWISTSIIDLSPPKRKKNTYKMMNLPILSVHRYKKLLSLSHTTLPVQTRRQLATDPEMCMFALIMSTAKPKNIKEAMANSAWIEAMQEELHQFDRLQVWELIDKPFGKTVIRLKWLWKNKKDEDQTVIRNKA